MPHDIHHSPPERPNAVPRGAAGAGARDDPPLVAATACAAAVLLHLVAVGLLPDLQIHPIQTIQQRVVLVQLAPPASPAAAIPAELRLPGAALGIATREPPGGDAAPAEGQSAAIQPDPLAPPDVTVAKAHAGSGGAGEGAGAGDGAGGGTGSGDGSDAGGGHGLGFVIYDEKPLLLQQAPARYPPGARSTRAKGTVLVAVLVDTSGRVEQAQLVDSVHPLLDQEALRAARGCTFRPGRQGGAPAPAWITLSYRFDPP